jgi:hypothetical protein
LKQLPSRHFPDAVQHHKHVHARLARYGGAPLVRDRHEFGATSMELVKVPGLRRITSLRCARETPCDPAGKRKNPNSVRSWGSFELLVRHGGDGCA